MRRAAIVLAAIAVLGAGCSSGSSGSASPERWLGGCFPEGTPLNFLSGPANAEKGTDGAADALRRFIAKPVGVRTVPSHGWRRIVRGSTANFTAPYVPDGPVMPFPTTTTPFEGSQLVGVTFAKKDGKWKYQSSAYGCTPEVQRHGLSGVQWAVDPASPASEPGMTRIAVLVTEKVCTSGTPIGDRLLKPEIVYGTDTITVTYWARSLSSGGKNHFFSCPGIAAANATLELSQPIGTRRLLDGSTVPPRPATTDRPSWIGN